MQPIVARPIAKPLGPVKYEIVAGERRWLAADQAGLVEIPAIIRDVPDADLVTLQLTENLQRKTIDQLEEAEAYDELRKLRKINADQVAELLGCSRTTVFNRLKLLDLCPEAIKELDAGKLTPSVALLIARLPDPKMQAKAAKGCLGGNDLGNFEPTETLEGPLTYTDAENYIKEEFTLRIEGAAAISRAKTEGKPVIAGADAKEIWKNSYGGPNGHVQIGETYWQGSKRKSYADTLGDNPPGMVLIQNPHTGHAVKCLPREDAARIFKEKKITLPHDLAPRNTTSSNSSTVKPQTPATKAKAEAQRAKERAALQRAEMKEQVEVDTRIAVFKALRVKSPAKLGKPELLEILEIFRDYGYGDFNKDLCPRPKSLTTCTEKELVRFVIDELYGNSIEDSYENDGIAMLAAAKRYGVNVAKITKEVTAAAEAKLKAATAAKGKPGVTPRKGKV